MTPESVGPLSRPVSIERLPAEGLDVSVDTTPEERAALARDFKLPAINALTGRYCLTGTPERIRVEGTVSANIRQICVVTLEPFDSDFEEAVEVDFASMADETGSTDDAQPVEDRPDEIVGGRIDLGALTAEFLALGLDPYPRKPGVDFSFESDDEDTPSPFAALKTLKPDD